MMNRNGRFADRSSSTSLEMGRDWARGVKIGGRPSISEISWRKFMWNSKASHAAKFFGSIFVKLGDAGLCTRACVLAVERQAYRLRSVIWTEVRPYHARLLSLLCSL